MIICGMWAMSFSILFFHVYGMMNEKLRNLYLAKDRDDTSPAQPQPVEPQPNINKSDLDSCLKETKST